MTLIAPRYELPLIDKDGRMSREWYKFLVQIANSIDRSGTSFDDLVTLQNTDSSEASALSALVASAKSSHLLFSEPDPVRPTDTALLALWPGETK